MMFAVNAYNQYLGSVKESETEKILSKFKEVS
jgi:hypothetical protein